MTIKFKHYRTVVHLQVLAAIMTIAVIFAFALSTAEPQLCCAKTALRTAPFYAIPLTIALFMVMWERASNPEKILGYKSQSEKTIFSSYLQNTVEQTILAVLSVMTLIAYVPVHFAVLITLSGWIFVVGRLLFLIGYLISPMWRFYGFSLNFYTSAALLIIGLWHMIQAM